MNVDWTPLDQELERWQSEDRKLPIWWRDDDATGATPALDRLYDISSALEMPVHLAIVPANVDPVLAGYMQDRPGLIPLVHGWTHSNHSPVGIKKAEFGETRPLGAMVEECGYAMRRMSLLFGRDLVPVFVPPWNRMAKALIPRLPGLGFTGFSTFTPRTNRFAAPGLWRVNTHVDPINWRAGGAIHDPDHVVRHVAGQLADRREGRVDADEPFGLLTHHLVHDEDIWWFCEALMQRLRRGPVRIWRADQDINQNGEPR